jgi:hypothetical protein
MGRLLVDLAVLLGILMDRDLVAIIDGLVVIIMDQEMENHLVVVKVMVVVQVDKDLDVVRRQEILMARHRRLPEVVGVGEIVSHHRHLHLVLLEACPRLWLVPMLLVGPLLIRPLLLAGLMLLVGPLLLMQDLALAGVVVGAARVSNSHFESVTKMF